MFWSQDHLKSFCLCEVYLLTFTILENETEKLKKNHFYSFKIHCEDIEQK